MEKIAQLDLTFHIAILVSTFFLGENFGKRFQPQNWPDLKHPHSIKQLPWTWQSTGGRWFAYSYVCSGYTRPLLSHVNIHKRPSHCKKIFWYLALYWVLVFCLPIDVFKCVALFCSILHYIVIAGRRHSVTGSCLSQGHCAQQASALWAIIKRNTASKIVISSM